MDKGIVAREVFGEHLLSPPVNRPTFSRDEKCHQKRMSKYFLPFRKGLKKRRLYHY